MSSYVLHALSNPNQTNLHQHAWPASMPGCLVAIAPLPGLGATTPEEMLKYYMLLLNITYVCFIDFIFFVTHHENTLHRSSVLLIVPFLGRPLALHLRLAWSQHRFGFANVFWHLEGKVMTCILTISSKQDQVLWPMGHKAVVRTQTAKLNSNSSNLIVDLP